MKSNDQQFSTARNDVAVTYRHLAERYEYYGDRTAAEELAYRSAALELPASGRNSTAAREEMNDRISGEAPVP